MPISNLFRKLSKKKGVAEQPTKISPDGQKANPTTSAETTSVAEIEPTTCGTPVPIDSVKSESCTKDAKSDVELEKEGNAKVGIVSEISSDHIIAGTSSITEVDSGAGQPIPTTVSEENKSSIEGNTIQQDSMKAGIEPDIIDETITEKSTIKSVTKSDSATFVSTEIVSETSTTNESYLENVRPDVDSKTTHSKGTDQEVINNNTSLGKLSNINEEELAKIDTVEIVPIVSEPKRLDHEISDSTESSTTSQICDNKIVTDISKDATEVESVTSVNSQSNRNFMETSESFVKDTVSNNDHAKLDGAETGTLNQPTNDVVHNSFKAETGMDFSIPISSKIIPDSLTKSEFCAEGIPDREQGKPDCTETGFTDQNQTIAPNQFEFATEKDVEQTEKSVSPESSENHESNDVMDDLNEDSEVITSEVEKELKVNKDVGISEVVDKILEDVMNMTDIVTQLRNASNGDHGNENCDYIYEKESSYYVSTSSEEIGTKEELNDLDDSKACNRQESSGSLYVTSDVIESRSPEAETPVNLAKNSNYDDADESEKESLTESFLKKKKDSDEDCQADSDMPQSASEIIRRLSGLIDETLKGEVLKEHLNKKRESVSSNVPETPVDDQKTPPEYLSEKDEVEPASAESEDLYIAHPGIYDESNSSVDTNSDKVELPERKPDSVHLGKTADESEQVQPDDETELSVQSKDSYENRSEQQIELEEETTESQTNRSEFQKTFDKKSDQLLQDTSENLMLDENDTKQTAKPFKPLVSNPPSIDILTDSVPPLIKDQDVGDVNVTSLKFQKNIDISDSVSIADSTLADQDDQGVYFPMPEFLQGNQEGNQTNQQQNWKVGYLRVKIPHKSRGRGKLKVWQKKLVVIQPDEFFDDQKNRSLILSIYQSDSTTSRRHNAAFWKSVCSKTALIYRSTSRTHPYAFTIADGQGPIIHLAADTESDSQEWMSAIRNVLWPPSSVMQLEKVLNGNEFEVSIIDNDFAYRAGLLGTYGYLAVTGRKLILCHPQSGHVIQEWYLNTVDNFRLQPMPKEVDTNKVLVMNTSSESSTGCGEIKFFCTEAIAFLQSLAKTIHQVLQYHTTSGDKKGCYNKELEEISHWLAPPQPNSLAVEEEHYKVPPRQVRSLLDIPNFIFDDQSDSTKSKLKPSTTCISTFSEDSGISVATSDDFLNSSHTSFTIGNRSLRRHDRTSSGSDLSDASYNTPPITPDMQRKSSTSAPT